MRRFLAALLLLFSSYSFAQSKLRVIPANLLIPNRPLLRPWPTGPAAQRAPSQDPPPRVPPSAAGVHLLRPQRSGDSLLQRKRNDGRSLRLALPLHLRSRRRPLGLRLPRHRLFFRLDPRHDLPPGSLRIYDAVSAARRGRPSSSTVSRSAARWPATSPPSARSPASSSPEPSQRHRGTPVYTHAHGLSAEMAAVASSADPIEAFNEVGNVARSTAPLSC